MPEPRITTWPATGPVRAVVLVLHGGAERSSGAVPPWKLAYLRMVPLARALHRAGAAHGVEVRLLRNRRYGWPDDPIAETRHVLERIRAEHPGVPVILAGHSMGGRVALRVADDPAVTAVCALAPWTPPGEPVDAPAGRRVLIVHGTRDRTTVPGESHAFAERAGRAGADVARVEIARGGHAMLRRAPVWTRLMCAFTLEAISAGEPDETLLKAWSAPPGSRLRVPV